MAGKVAATAKKKATASEDNAKLWAGALKSLKNQQKCKVTPALVDEICQLIRDGNRVTTACAKVGIVRETFYNHLRHEKEARALLEAGASYDDLEVRHVRGLYLVESISQALAEGETEDVQQIRARPNNWQAHAWLLERRFQKWRRTNPIASAADDGADELVLPEDRGEDEGPQFGFMLPAALPEDVYVEMVKKMRERGITLPGEHAASKPAPPEQTKPSG